MRDAVLYRERTPYPWWARAILWSAVAGGALATLLVDQDGGTTPAARVGTAAGLLALGVAFELLLGGLLVEVRPEGLRFGLGNARLLRGRIAWNDIARLESVRYRPIREFGGWGLRGTRRRRAWTARGDRAVVLHLVDGREVWLGSDSPQRLEERIRAVAGERFGEVRSGS